MSARWMSALATLALLAGALPAPAQSPSPSGSASPLPVGEGREIVQKNCATCHGLNLITNSGFTRAQWENLFPTMVALPAEERAAVSDYLARNFPPRVRPTAPVAPETAEIVWSVTQAIAADAATWAKAVTRSGRVAVYGIEFDPGTAAIRPEFENLLSRVVAVLAEEPGWSLAIECHTDAAKPSAENRTLSQQRADAVVAWLVAHRIEAARLTAVGLGDTRPVASNGTEDGRARNRRLEFFRF